MRARLILQGLAALLGLLLLVAFSPLTDADTGWRNTVGDVVWTAMSLTFAALVGFGGYILISQRSW